MSSEIKAPVSVTIKTPESRRYAGDNPWTVFYGTVAEVKANLIEAFGLPEESKDFTLASVVTNAQAIASGRGVISGVLGGTVVEDKPTSGDEAFRRQDGEAGGEEDKPAANPNAGLIAALGTAESVEDLKRLWATNKAAFEDKAVQEAYQSRGKALKAA